MDKERIVKKITRAGEQPASHWCPRARPIIFRPTGWVTTRRWRENCWPRPVIPVARVFRGLNTCSTPRRAARRKFTRTSPSNCSRCGATQLGIQMELRQVEWKVYLERDGRTWITSLARSSWIGDYNDPQTFLGMFISNNGNNRTGWKNARLRRAHHARPTSRPDLKKREQIFQQAETLLVSRRGAHHPALFLRRHQLFRHEQNPGHLSKHSRRPSVAMHPQNGSRVESRGTSA